MVQWKMAGHLKGFKLLEIHPFFNWTVIMGGRVFKKNDHLFKGFHQALGIGNSADLFSGMDKRNPKPSRTAVIPSSSNLLEPGVHCNPMFFLATGSNRFQMYV